VASVLDDRFGFIVYGNNVARVRSESSDAEVTAFEPKGRSFTAVSRTVSPDGRSVAYWDPVDNGAVLRVRPVTGGAARAVFTAAAGMKGNAFAWSSDATGLVIAVDNDCQEICGAQGGRSFAELWTADLAGGATARIASGKIWLPVTWDRGTQLVAAGVTGPGGYLSAYDVIELKPQPTAVRSTPFQPPVIGRLRASTDARGVLLTFDQGGLTGLAWWPLAEPERRAAVEFDGNAAEWRPGTTEIWWVGGLTPAGCQARPCSGTQLTSFDTRSGARAVAFRGSVGGALVGFRVDRAAAITAADVSVPGSNATELTFVEIATGRSAKVSVSGVFGGAFQLR
jgi:hypothetical protein